jgi:hypothetical protein
VPSGDAYNYLGSGALGIKPFLVLSVAYGRLSPHFNLGYQWNAKSVLAGDLATGYKRHLPSQIPYAAGVDVGISRRLTLDFDVLGQELINADRINVTRYTNDGANFADLGPVRKGAANITNGSFGIKLNPAGRLLFYANVLFKMNDAGIRGSVAPLFGLTYTR